MIQISMPFTKLVEFLFLYQLAIVNLTVRLEFVDHTNIGLYPPPLHLLAWRLLNQKERQQALKALQSINKEHVCNALDEHGRKRPKPGRYWKESDPPEWRAWSNTKEKEKEETFEQLQVSSIPKYCSNPLTRTFRKQARISLPVMFRGRAVISQLLPNKAQTKIFPKSSPSLLMKTPHQEILRQSRQHF